MSLLHKKICAHIIICYVFADFNKFCNCTSSKFSSYLKSFFLSTLFQYFLLYCTDKYIKLSILSCCCVATFETFYSWEYCIGTCRYLNKPVPFISEFFASNYLAGICKNAAIGSVTFPLIHKNIFYCGLYLSLTLNHSDNLLRNYCSPPLTVITKQITCGGIFRFPLLLHNQWRNLNFSHIYVQPCR